MQAPKYLFFLDRNAIDPTNKRFHTANSTLIGAFDTPVFNTNLELGRKRPWTFCIVNVEKKAIRDADFNIIVIFQQLVAEYRDLLKKKQNKNNLVAKYNIQHISTRGLPVAETARRLPSDKLRIARPKFDYIIQAGICRPCSSAYVSPIHIVPKKKERRKLTYLRQLSQTERASRSGSTIFCLLIALHYP